MSVNFEFFLACNLKEDTPKQVMDILAYLVSMDANSFEPPPSMPDILPDHFFFSMDMWSWVFANKDAFAGDGFTKLAPAHFEDQYDLTVRVKVRKEYSLIAA